MVDKKIEDKNILDRIKDVFEGRDKTKKSRFAILIAIGFIEVIAIVIYYFASNYKIFLFGDNSFIGDMNTFHALLISLPVAVVLWAYRTIDTTENLYFNSFSHATNLLQDTKNIHAIEAGVTLLIELSKQTKFYNNSITNIFVHLLSIRVPIEQYVDTESETRAFKYRSQYVRKYAQEILEFLDGVKGGIGKLTTPPTYLSNQEFDLDNKESTANLKKIIPKLFPKAMVISRERKKLLKVIPLPLEDVSIDNRSHEESKRITQKGCIFFLAHGNGANRMVLCYLGGSHLIYDTKNSIGDSNKKFEELGFTTEDFPPASVSTDKGS